MSCFSCLKDVNNCDGEEFAGHGKGRRYKDVTVTDSMKEKSAALSNQRANVARSFTFRELAASTQNSRAANLIGEGGFGSVYKGRLQSGKMEKSETWRNAILLRQYLRY